MEARPENPRRLRLKRSRCRPRACRLLTVPSGHPSARRFLVRLAFQVTEHERKAVTFRQPVDFLVQDRGIVIAVGVRSLPLDSIRPPAVRGLRPGERLARRAVSDSARNRKQPGAERLPDVQLAGLVGQNKNVA